MSRIKLFAANQTPSFFRARAAYLPSRLSASPSTSWNIPSGMHKELAPCSVKRAICSGSSIMTVNDSQAWTNLPSKCPPVPSIIYSLDRLNALIKVVPDFFHLNHHIGQIDYVGVSVAAGDNQYNVFRLGGHKVQELLEIDNSFMDRYVGFIKNNHGIVAIQHGLTRFLQCLLPCRQILWFHLPLTNEPASPHGPDRKQRRDGLRCKMLTRGVRAFKELHHENS